MSTAKLIVFFAVATILAPAAVDARVPVGVARPYASMLLEAREGQLSVIPVEPFRTGLNPSDGDLQSFYAQNRQRYLVPEQRVLQGVALIRHHKLAPREPPRPVRLGQQVARVEHAHGCHAGLVSRHEVRAGLHELAVRARLLLGR